MAGPLQSQGERGSAPPPKHPRDIWAQVVDGPPPSNTAHPTTAPTRPRRQQPRTPAPTPELNATQKWWAAFMGDRAFARARAAGKNETEAGHARAKAEADIALSLPAEYRDLKNDTRAEYIMHSAQPAAERRWSNRRTYTHAARGL